MHKVKCDNNNGMRSFCNFCNDNTCQPICKDPSSTIVKCIKCGAYYDGYSGAKEKEFYEARKLKKE